MKRSENQFVCPNPPDFVGINSGSLIFNAFPLGIKGQKALKIQMKDL